MLRQLLFAALVATAFAEPPDASWTKTLKAVLAEPVHITSLAYHNRDGALRWIGFTPRNRVVFSWAGTDFDGTEGIHFNNCDCKGCDGHYVRAHAPTHLHAHSQQH